MHADKTKRPRTVEGNYIGHTDSNITMYKKVVHSLNYTDSIYCNVIDFQVIRCKTLKLALTPSKSSIISLSIIIGRVSSAVDNDEVRAASIEPSLSFLKVKLDTSLAAS